MNRFAVSLIWVIITFAACYGVVVGYESLTSKPISTKTNTTSVLTKDLKGASSVQPVEVVEPDTKDEEPVVANTLIDTDFTKRVQALPQADFDRFTRRLDDLIAASVVIKKESMGKRVSEFKEIINLVLNKTLQVTKEGSDEMVLQVNLLKNYFKLPEDSLADKGLHEALKKLLLDARNS